MSRISGVALRRAVVVPVLVALVPLAGCGGDSSDGGETAEQPSESTSSSPADGGEPESGEPGSNANGECGGGEVETATVEAAEGVQLTVPAAWRTQGDDGAEQIALLPPDRGAGDGFLVVQDEGQSLDEAVDDALEFTRESASTTSEQDLDLAGFEGARMVTFVYDDADQMFSVYVVAVSEDGLRVVANMTREDAEEQPLAESCLSTLSRTP